MTPHALDLATTLEGDPAGLSFGDQTVALYGEGGQLLATAVQVAYFRA